MQVSPKCSDADIRLVSYCESLSRDTTKPHAVHSFSGSWLVRSGSRQASLILFFSLQVRNLPLSATDETLLREFSRFKPGCVQRVKKLTDYAFVHYSCREDAMEALSLMRGAVIDGATVEVMLAKPAVVKDRNSRRNHGRASQGSGSPEGGGAAAAVERDPAWSPVRSPEDRKASQTRCNYIHCPAEGELALFYTSCAC